MSEMRLTHADATALFNQVDEALAQARQGLQAMQDTATQMTSGSWLGEAAKKFHGQWQAACDDGHDLHNQLSQVCEHGKYSANTLASHDAE